MWYWNKSNFEGLAEVSEAIKDKEQWHLFKTYLQLRERGLRKQALLAISELINDAKQWTTVERRHFADWVYDTKIRVPDARQLIVTPLNDELLIPTLQEWASSEPENYIPHRWLGFATGDY